MGDIDLMAELDQPCPRGCGRSVDGCDEAEDGEDCPGSPLVQQLEREMEKRFRQIESRDRTIAELGASNARLIRELDELANAICAAIPDPEGRAAIHRFETYKHNYDWYEEHFTDLADKHRAAELELDRLRAELARKNADLDLTLAKLVKTGAVVEAAKSWAMARRELQRTSSPADGVDLVFERYIEAQSILAAAVRALAAPSNPADWVDDPAMPADEAEAMGEAVQVAGAVMANLGVTSRELADEWSGVDYSPGERCESCYLNGYEIVRCYRAKGHPHDHRSGILTTSPKWPNAEDPYRADSRAQAGEEVAG